MNLSGLQGQLGGTHRRRVSRGGHSRESSGRTPRLDGGLLPTRTAVPAIRPLAVTGIGSRPWPGAGCCRRFTITSAAGSARMNSRRRPTTPCGCASRLSCVHGIRVVTDGEPRRDRYASFVGGRLDNCQLIPITDLLPYVDDPAEFEQEPRALDVLAGKCGTRPCSAGSDAAARWPCTNCSLPPTLTDSPIKVALPGPYLLTRTMWLECVSDRTYPNREALAEDIVRVLRGNCFICWQPEGPTLVQFDEPVLTEVVFGEPHGTIRFMCGELSAETGAAGRVGFRCLVTQTSRGRHPRPAHGDSHLSGKLGPQRIRGPGQQLSASVAAAVRLQVGNYFLELCTPRAGELDVLRDLPTDRRIGVGSVIQKLDRVETADEIVRRAEAAVQLFGAERLLLTPDCGFATFADNPIASAEVAENKLTALVEAKRRLAGTTLLAENTSRRVRREQDRICMTNTPTDATRTAVVPATTNPGVRHGRAFTLTELLVVLAVIAVLLAVLLPAVQAAQHRKQAHATSAWLRLSILMGLPADLLGAKH